MKGLFFLFLSVLCLNSYSQNNINPALLFQVSGVPSASGNVYTVSGNTQETTGAGWNASTVAVGDSLFYYDSGNIYPLVVSSIISASGNALSITATSIAPFVSTSPSNGNLSGAIVITRKYSNGTCPIPSNLNAPLAAALESRNKIKVQATIVSGVNIKTINSTSIVGLGDVVISGGATYTGTSPVTVTGSTISVNKLDSNKLVVGGIQASALAQSTIDSLKKVITDTLYVLATGQSNMVGYGYGGDTTINPKVQVFETMSNQWQVATRKNVHDSLQLSAGFVYYGHYTTENNSLAWCFAKNLQKKTGKPVKLLVSAMGGQPITQWAIGQPQWTRITTTLSSSNIPRVDVILWLQGEADATNNTTNWNYYVNALTTVISNLRNLSVCNNQTPIILNKLIPANYDFFNGIYDKIANPTGSQQQQYVGVNSSFGLTSVGDAVHYSGGALDTLGQRALSVYLSLPNTIKTTSIIVPVSTRNETTYQSGLMLISNAGRDSSSGTALNFGINYSGVNSPITSGGRILVTSSDTNTTSGTGGYGKMTLGVKYGYSKEGLSQSLFQTDAITIVPGLIGINNPSPQYALDIKPFFTGNPVAIRSMNSYPLYSNSILCAASDANGGFLYRLTDNVLMTDASGKIAPSSITNLSTSTNTGFKVMGNLTGTLSGSGLELTYGGTTGSVYSYDRTAGSGAGLTLSLGGFGGYNVIGGNTANTSYTNTITGGNTLVTAGLDVTGTLTANAKLNANANAKILGTFENYQNTTYGNSTYAVSIGNGGASDNYFKGDNTYWQNSSGGSLATLNATGLGLGIGAAYKLDVLSSANPLRLQGLQTGASTDLIVTSNAGVLRTQTAAQIVANGITKTSVTSTFTVAASGEYLIPFTLTGTTQASIVAATYIATDVTGCSFSIPFLAGDGTGTVKVTNKTASAVTFTSLKVNFAVVSY